MPHGGAEALARPPRRVAPRQLPERLAADLARLTDTGIAERYDGASPAAKPAPRRVGDAAEIWAPILAPEHGPRSRRTRALLVLDEPGDLAEAAEFLWRQADERRAELVEAGEIPKAWPATLPRRRALEGAPRSAPGRWS